MTKYIFAYHEGSIPESPEEQQKIMAEWMAWVGGHQAAFADIGAPVGDNRIVSASGVETGGGQNALTGYGFIAADTIDDAIEIAKGCPVIADGGSVEVASVYEM